MKGKKSYKRLFVMSAAALGMTALVGLKDASAYFTTYVSAGGSQVVHMGAQTEIYEDLSAMTKHISIANTSQDQDCFVRVRVFYGSLFTVDFDDESGLWSEGEDGYWYYEPALAPGERTEELHAKINVPENFAGDSFNVIVIQECTPLSYDADGNPTADWSTVYTDTNYRGEEAGD